MAQPGFYIFSASNNADLSEEWLNLDADGNPVDMTGWSAITQFRKVKGGAVQLEMSTANGRITLGSDGTVKHSVPEATMRGLTAWTGSYDTLLIDGSGKVERFLTGPAEIVDGISKVGGGA